MNARLKRLTAILLSAVLVLTAFVLPSPVMAAEPNAVGSIQAEFFVDPVEGNDKNDGSYEKPFATVQAARDAVREINDKMTGDIYVFLAAGEYYMDETLVFTEEDSGTNGYKVVYRNLDEIGSAELIGGRKVESAWTAVTKSDNVNDPDSDLPASVSGKVYKTKVGTALGGDSINTANVNDDGVFYTLYVNDQRATLARTQNRDNSSGFTSALTPYMRSAGGGVGDLYYYSGNLDQDTINGLVNAQARGDLNASVYMWDGGYWDWMTDTIPVSAIDTSNNRLVYKTVDGHSEVYRPKYATRNNARYFLQGNLGMLDVPGEYYYNSKTGDLYYYPEAGTTMDDYDIVIPYVQEIIRVEGASKDSKVHDIEFSGLTIKDADHTEWYAYGWNWGDGGNGLGFYPDEAAGSTQPSYCEQTERIEFQYGNITLKNTDNIAITNSRIKNSGMFGIELYLANTNARIENCVIEYTAHGGINFDGGYPGVAGDANGDGYSNHNTVYNCLIHDIGELVGQASGFTIQQSGYNTVSHVEIYNSPRRGVFLTAGHSRNAGGADAGYNPMTDLYTHHNTIEYVYLHDCQQDGGDDGAFFACYLWKGANNKPNYVNQMVIENVAANPSMTDIAPNGINLDMGASGMELRNVKVVNPQHYNLEVNTILQYGDKIEFDNVNIDYGTLVNHLDAFDDSKMEYDQIGLTVDFPAAFKPVEKPEETLTNVYFSEDFENGIDYNKWSAEGTPAITTEWMSEGALAGRQALMINSDSGKPVLYREFAQSLNKVVTVKLFDRAGFNICAYDSGVKINESITTYARVDDGETVVAMGIDNAVGGGSGGVYVLQVGNQKIKTGISRYYGWHELKWDYSSGDKVDLYFDGQLVKTLTAADGVSMDFNYVALGSETGSGVTFFDELNIYGGENAGDPGSVELPATPAAIPGAIEVVDATKLVNCQIDGDHIGYIGSDSEMHYYVSVASAGDYTLTASVAVNQDNNRELELIADGTSRGTLTFNSTGSWDTYTDASTKVYLPAGVYEIVLKAQTNGFNVRSFTFAPYEGSEAPAEPADPNVYLALDFEDGKLPEGVIYKNSASENDCKIVDVEGGKALQINSTDGGIFFNHGANWENYELTFDWTMNGWADDEWAWDHFTVYTMTSGSNTTNPNSLQLVYRRNKSGGYGPAGTPSFQFNYRSSSGDNSGQPVALPEGFNQTGTHQVRILATPGKIEAYVDGILIGTREAAEVTKGGIGFSVCHGNCTIDNLKVTKIATPELKLDFEDGSFDVAMDCTLKYGGSDPANIAAEVETEGDNSYLHVTAKDGGVFLEGTEPWANYTLKFKMKFVNWLTPGNASYHFEHFTTCLRTSSKPEYEIIYRKNSEGTEEGAVGGVKGVEHFAIKYHPQSGGDTNLLNPVVPTADYLTDGWNDFEITAIDNVITLKVNGKQVASVIDAGSNLTSGGIGFSGYASEFYLDDIELTLIEDETSGSEESEEPSVDDSNGLLLNFENGNLPEFYLTNTDTAKLWQQIKEENGNKYLQQFSGDGHAFYKTDNKEWQNYMVSFKWRFDGWGDLNVLNYACDNFTCFVMTNYTSDSRANNPSSYQVIYRRNWNGNDKFPAGTAYFEICKHTSGSDPSLAVVAAPAGFNPAEWHTFQIQTFDGKVGFAIDGVRLCSVEDGTYTYGGIGFGGINALFSLDDIQITLNPQSVSYGKKLGLTNIEMNGTFNPNYYHYYVRVADPTQSVNFTMPKIVVDGTQLTVTLNGEAITADGALNLVNGANTLVMKEETLAGPKVYTVTIYKNVQVSRVEDLAPVTTALGVAPELPATITATFADGSTQPVAINWKQIHPKQYQKTGSFTAKGSLDGIDYPVEIAVTVNGLTGVAVLPQVTTEVGTAPTLAANLTAHYSDGDKPLALTFDTLDASLYANPGVIFAVGRAEGYAFDVLQKVVVKGTPVNKTALKTLVEEAKALKETDYTEETWKAFEKILADADMVLGDTNASQDDVNAAVTALTQAKNALVKKGDPTELNKLLAEVDALAEADYTANSWKPLADAVQKAKKLLSDLSNVTQKDLDDAAKAVRDARSGLVERADSSDLEALLAQAEALNKEDYTEDSWADLEAAINEAKALLNDSNVSEETLAQAAKAVRDAMGALVPSSFTITVKQNRGGAITPDTMQVATGEDAVFTIQADFGYVVTDVLVDGRSVDCNGTYVFRNVNADHVIEARFTCILDDLLILGGAGGPNGAEAFTDVNPGDWFYDAVDYVAAEGLMNGTSDNTFSPALTTTRGMIVTILYRHAGSPKVVSNGTEWWADARVWAMENGLSDGTNMTGNITREQLAAMLYRYAGYLRMNVNAEGSLSSFTDGNRVSGWAEDAMEWAVGAGILNGKTGGLLDPQGNATRAEVAAMLQRFCKLG